MVQANGTDQNTPHQSDHTRVADAMPSRRERLRTFMRLKSQRRWLAGSVAALSVMAVGLGTALAVDGDNPETVRLGTGQASVEVQPVDAFAPNTGDGNGPDAQANASESAIGSGEASYYGAGFEGRPTANGERFDSRKLTAAHRTLPMGSRVRVTNPKTGDSVVVRVNDRGPFHGNRVIDLSEAAARAIGLIQSGTGTVRLSLIL